MLCVNSFLTVMKLVFASKLISFVSQFKLGLDEVLVLGELCFRHHEVYSSLRYQQVTTI